MKKVLSHINLTSHQRLTMWCGSAEMAAAVFVVLMVCIGARPLSISPEAIVEAPSQSSHIVETTSTLPVVTDVKPDTTVQAFPEKTSPEDRFHPIIARAAERYEVDPALVKAIIKAESGYDEKAVSKRGAMGLMQLMPGTARELGVIDGFDPEHNINGGVRYFRRLMDQFQGNVSFALAAYNAGSKKVRHYRGIPPFKATRYYVKKVFRYYEFYKNQTPKNVNNA